MISRIVRSSMKLRFVVVTVAALLVFFGISQLRYVSVDPYPEFMPPQVQIQIESLGLSAAEMEALMTVSLEGGIINEVAWLKDIRSESIPGLASITLEFDPGVDLMDARLVTEERLLQAQATPNVSQPPQVLQPLSATSRVMKVGMTSDDVSLIDMSLLARWTIKPRLMGVDGVANVAIWGQRERQLQVLVDPERLREHGVSLNQIISTTGNAMWVSPLSYLNASTPGAGGWIDTPNQRLGIRHVLPIIEASDLGKVVIEGTSLRLEQVANVVEGHQPLIGDAIFDDGPGLLLVIEKFPWANTLEVTRGVEATLAAMRPGMAGITFDSEIYRPATFVETAAGNLGTALLIGGLLVAALLIYYFRDGRSALISLIVMPLSLITAGFVLHLAGATFDMMVIAGLMAALGVIVDDAIIDVSNIRQRLAQHPAQGGDTPVLKIIFEAALEMRRAITVALFICVLAAAPAFFVEGLAGAFFKPLATAYVLAVVVSMAVALTLTPALSVLLLKGATSAHRESPLLAWLHRQFDAHVAPRFDQPRLARNITVVGVGFVVVVLPFLGGGALYPIFKERDLVMPWESPPGTSYPAISRLADEVGDELRAIPGVAKVVSHMGRAITGDQVVGINASQFWIRLKPSANYNTTVAAVQQVADRYPEFSHGVLTYPQLRLMQADDNGVSDEHAVVRVYGPEMAVLRGKAAELRQAMAEIDGVADAQVDSPVTEPKVEIEVDLDAAKRHGAKPGDIRRDAGTLLSGLVVGNHFEEQKVFEVVVWGSPDVRRTVDDIGELLIDTPRSGLVPLKDLADVRVVQAPVSIKRQAASRYLDVNVQIAGGGHAAVIAEMERRIGAVDFPVEYHAEVKVDASGSQHAAFLFALLAVAGMFMILQAYFGSWRLALAVLVSLPVALAGGVLATVMMGGLSLGALLGLLAVFAIAARHGIMLIDHYQHLLQLEGESFGPALVLRGTRERLGPIALSTLTTAVLVLPMMLLGNAAGLELMGPMAFALWGGLVTTALFSVLVIPAVYARYGEPVAVPPETEAAGGAVMKAPWLNQGPIQARDKQ